MSPYDSPEAFRQALEFRLREQARDRGWTLDRVRRDLVFECVVRRLSIAEPNGWVVKGGMALEWRLGRTARATQDLDMAVRSSAGTSIIAERLADALVHDRAGDRFEFVIGRGEQLVGGGDDPGTLRLPIESRIGGRTFERVRLDVSGREKELVATTFLDLPTVLSFIGLGPLHAELVAPAQHFAEKLHALTRQLGDRVNSRTHDIVDMALLIESFDLDPATAFRTAEHVFRVRSTHELPRSLPDPPTGWTDIYADEALRCGVRAKTLDDALALVRAFWSDAHTAAEDPHA